MTYLGDEVVGVDFWLCQETRVARGGDGRVRSAASWRRKCVAVGCEPAVAVHVQRVLDKYKGNKGDVVKEALTRQFSTS